MFNRDDMGQPSVSPHNIYETMSRSRKRMPGSTRCCCKSQKKGKQASSCKFRRRHMCYYNREKKKFQQTILAMGKRCFAYKRKMFCL